MDAIKGFLRGYSDNFLVALGLWPFASAVLTLPALAWVYHREGRLSMRSMVSVYLSVLYLLGLACFTLYPLPSGDSGLGITYGAPVQVNPFAFIGDIAEDGLSAVAQILANIVFFIPLGIVADRMLGAKFPVALLISFGISLLIETAQLTGLFGIYAYSYRTFDVDDLIWNTSGAALGWIISRVLGKVLCSPEPGHVEVTHNPGFVRRIVALWIDFTLVLCVIAVAASIVGVVVRITGVGAIGVVLAWYIPYAALVCVILLEIILPWLRDGQTLGGAFVHMSFETKRREGAKRAWFYAIRLVALCAAFVFPFPVAVLLVIFYLCDHKMLYDLLP